MSTELSADGMWIVHLTAQMPQLNRVTINLRHQQSGNGEQCKRAFSKEYGNLTDIDQVASLELRLWDWPDLRPPEFNYSDRGQLAMRWTATSRKLEDLEAGWEPEPSSDSEDETSSDEDGEAADDAEAEDDTGPEEDVGSESTSQH